MILYSVTLNLNSEIEIEWLEYMQQTHIPAVMATGFFESFTLLRLINPSSEEGTRTYNVQYTCESLGRLAVYQRDHAPALQAEHTEKFQNQFVAFRSVLQKV